VLQVAVDDEGGRLRGGDPVGDLLRQVLAEPPGVGDLAVPDHLDLPDLGVVEFVGHVVHRQGDEDRSGGRGHRDVDRAGDDRGYLARGGRLGGPFDERTRNHDGVLVRQEGLLILHGTTLVARDDDERGLVQVGVVQGAHGVAEAGRGVQEYQRWTSGDLRKAVGHTDRHHFLQTQEIAEVAGEVLQQGQFRGAGIAEPCVELMLPEQVDGGLTDSRHGKPFVEHLRRGSRGGCAIGGSVARFWLLELIAGAQRVLLEKERPGRRDRHDLRRRGRPHCPGGPLRQGPFDRPTGDDDVQGADGAGDGLPTAGPPEEWEGATGGVDVLALLAERAGATLPAPFTVTTPSGGTHFYYRAPSGVELRNTAGLPARRCRPAGTSRSTPGSPRILAPAWS
jgi:hypothetical protein